MTDTTLKDRLNTAVKEAMRQRDRERLGTLRMATAAIKQYEVDQRVDAGDSDVIALLDRMVKQHNESIEQYRAAGRDDLVDREVQERDVLREFLPEPVSDEELDGLVEQAMRDTGATTVRDMGQVMGQLKPQLQGRADMSQVSARVKQRLQGSG